MWKRRVTGRCTVSCCRYKKFCASLQPSGAQQNCRSWWNIHVVLLAWHCQTCCLLRVSPTLQLKIDCVASCIVFEKLQCLGPCAHCVTVGCLLQPFWIVKLLEEAIVNPNRHVIMHCFKLSAWVSDWSPGRIVQHSSLSDKPFWLSQVAGIVNGCHVQSMDVVGKVRLLFSLITLLENFNKLHKICSTCLHH